MSRRRCHKMIQKILILLTIVYGSIYCAENASANATASAAADVKSSCEPKTNAEKAILQKKICSI